MREYVNKSLRAPGSSHPEDQYFALLGALKRLCDAPTDDLTRPAYQQALQDARNLAYFKVKASDYLKSIGVESSDDD